MLLRITDKKQERKRSCFLYIAFFADAETLKRHDTMRYLLRWEKARRRLICFRRGRGLLLPCKNDVASYPNGRPMVAPTNNISMVPSSPRFKSKKSRPKSALFQILLILALAGCFCLLLALYAGLLIALSLAELCENAGSLTLSLKSTKSAIQRFIFFYSYFCHYLSLPSHCKQREFFSNSTQYNNTSVLLCQVKV